MSNNFDLNILLDDVNQYIGWGRVDQSGINYSYGPRLDSVDFDPSAVGHAAPIGSVTMRRDIAQVWQKDGVLDTDWVLLNNGVPPIVGTQYCFVWRPGVALDFENVYGTWQDLYTATLLVQGKKLIVLDASEGSPFFLANGGQNVEEFDLVILGSEEISIDIVDNWINLPASITGPSRWNWLGAGNLLFVLGDTPVYYRTVLKDNVTLYADIQTMFRVDGIGMVAGEGPILSIKTDRDCRLLGFGAGGHTLIQMDGTGTVDLIFGEGCGSDGELLVTDSDPENTYSTTFRADADERTSTISSAALSATTLIKVPKRTRNFGSITSATVLDSTDLLVDIWECAAAGGAGYNVTLPDTDPNFEGVEMTFKNINAGASDTNIITLVSVDIDGGTTFLLNFQDSVTITRHGSTWRVISAYVA